MFRNYRPYIPKAVGELIDLFGSVVLSAPTFEDTTGYFPGKNIDTEFLAMYEGLKNVKSKIGEDNYQALLAMTGQMRAYFDADPEDKTGDTTKGMQLALDMIEILEAGEGEDYWE
jgi:hypothetical protein